MKTRKLSSVDGFVLLDLENAPGSVGVVRSAPKILVSGAEMLARSVTYTFAAFGIRAGGASAGVNAGRCTISNREDACRSSRIVRAL